VVIGARPGVGATTPTSPKASTTSRVTVAGLQVPFASEEPKDGLGGMVAPGRGGVGSPPEISAVLALSEKLGAAVQVVIAPTGACAIEAGVPGRSGIAPSTPVVGVGIVPGTLRPGTGVVASIAELGGAGIPIPIVGARALRGDLACICCAKAELLPSRTRSGAMKMIFRIGASKFDSLTARSSGPHRAAAAPCRRRRA
jgi:hypothetical protein